MRVGTTWGKLLGPTLLIGLISCGGGGGGVPKNKGAGGSGTTPTVVGGTTPIATGGAGPAGGGIGVGVGSAPGAGGTGSSNGGSVSTGSGGVGGIAMVPGTGGTGPVIMQPGSGGGGGSGGADVCNALTVVPQPVVPTVLILVDNSSSMYEPREQLWDLLYTTLMDPTTGVIKPLESQVRFGFASYKGHNQPSMTEDDLTCATMTTVPFALNNHAAIDTVYYALGDWDFQKYETPTGFAINQVASQMSALDVNLANYTADPPGPKYILLVTDGNPNTCVVLDPQCGQDQAIKAAQDAYALGIGTFVIGIGDIVTGQCDTNAGRCGALHLQDIANAGTGQPVTRPPDQYLYQQCVAGTNGGAGVLTATYADAGGMAPYYTATNGTELQTAIQGLLNSVVSCTFDMDAIVTGDASLGNVMIGTMPLVYDDANGWRLEPNNYQVTLQGAACDAFKTGDFDLNITFPCAPDGTPIAVPK